MDKDNSGRGKGRGRGRGRGRDEIPNPTEVPQSGDSIHSGSTFDPIRDAANRNRESTHQTPAQGRNEQTPDHVQRPNMASSVTDATIQGGMRGVQDILRQREILQDTSTQEEMGRGRSSTSMRRKVSRSVEMQKKGKKIRIEEQQQEQAGSSNQASIPPGAPSNWNTTNPQNLDTSAFWEKPNYSYGGTKGKAQLWKDPNESPEEYMKRLQDKYKGVPMRPNREQQSKLREAARAIGDFTNIIDINAPMHQDRVAQQEADRWRREAETLRREVETLRRENERWRQGVEALRQDNEQSRREVETLAQANRRLGQEADRWRQETGILGQVNGVLVQEVDRWKQEAATLKQEIDNAEKFPIVNVNPSEKRRRNAALSISQKKKHKDPEYTQSLNEKSALKISGGKTKNLSEAMKDPKRQKYLKDRTRGNLEKSKDKAKPAESTKDSAINALRSSIAGHRNAFIRDVFSRSDILQQTFANMQEHLSRVSESQQDQLPVTTLETSLAALINAMEEASQSDLDTIRTNRNQGGRNPLDVNLDRIEENPQANLLNGVDRALYALRQANENYESEEQRRQQSNQNVSHTIGKGKKKQ